MARHSDELTFAGITVSRKALRKKIADTQDKREAAERQGAEVARKPTPARSLAFSEKVCAWAKPTGYLVRGKLKGCNPDDLDKQLCAWFKSALKTDDVETALARGLEIKGLGVSFASKHLRMLQPKRFATLDSILSQELGFALSCAEYARFLRELRAFRRRYGLREPIGTLETGLFLLIRCGDFKRLHGVATKPTLPRPRRTASP